MLFHFLAFQKIIAGSWVFGLVFNIPLIMINKLRNNFCAGIWPEEWMGKAFGVYSNVIVFGSLFGIFVLHFRVVHTLWFKSAGVRQVNQEQSVSSVKNVLHMIYGVMAFTTDG